MNTLGTNGSVLVQDGGPPTPEAWAQATVKQLVQIDPEASSEVQARAHAFRRDVHELLTTHHGKVQEHERGHLTKEGGHARLSQGIDPTEHASPVLDEFLQVAGKHGFGSHFGQDGVRGAVAGILATHFATSIFTERSWHADRHPESGHSKAFRERHHPQQARGA